MPVFVDTGDLRIPLSGVEPISVGGSVMLVSNGSICCRSVVNAVEERLQQNHGPLVMVGRRS